MLNKEYLNNNSFNFIVEILLKLLLTTVCITYKLQTSILIG